MTQDKQPPLTYAAVGVDLEKRRGIVERYKEVSKKATRPEVLGGIGPFAGLFALGTKYKDPVIVASTDSVGTKIKLAALTQRYESVGHDVVNQSINDVLTTGAEPIFFLDYIASADLTPDAKVELVKGVSDACIAANCALLGGETADMPGIYAPGDYDIVGFAVGAVERENVIDGTRIEPGNLLFGLPSNGLHTNGYSLARAALEIGIDSASAETDRTRLAKHEEELGESLADALLKPHLSYSTDLRPALSIIRGMAHITAGGFEENIPRILPDDMGARIEQDAWTVPPIFPFIQRAGQIEDQEMYRVFNMGIGMVLCVSLADAGQFQRLVPQALELGEVTAVKNAGPRIERR